MKIWLWIVLLSLISIYNTVYGFLSKSLQDKIWIKLIGILAAAVLLVCGIFQMVTDYLNYSYAIVSELGQIIKSKNFPWTITKTTDKDGIVYIIDKCYIDVSLIDVKTINKAATVEKYMAIDGAAIRFIGSGFGDPIIGVEFKIEIRR